MAAKRKYPWERWFKRPVLRLRRGEDYSCMPHCMSVQIRRNAAEHGVHVSVLIDGNTIVVTRKAS